MRVLKLRTGELSTHNQLGGSIRVRGLLTTCESLRFFQYLANFLALFDDVLQRLPGLRIGIGGRYLTTAPLETNTEVIQIGVTFLPVTLRVPVGQQYAPLNQRLFGIGFI